ncbi:glycoside hydrolase family protein [Marinoscillum furvescens]|uniref:Glycosyl hydrolase family 43 n=1 Tax=Marinoscillum furvescens DSM 4134 TaxID=1122208 RepID=A0A3D9L034_MARFU|nr:glycoside hydrolase family protein [Marinoscillum furvescens]RED93011.1 hypothetical protein C7460_12735 [Marinoscillum furvescens DSM 4134]
MLKQLITLFIFVLATGITFAQSGEMNLGERVIPVSPADKFIDPDYHIWGASVIKGDDGKYHMYYSRWPYELGHMAWVTHSEIAHAVADSASGAFRHVDVALPARGKAYWDGSTTHNPTVFKKDGVYYLYYMGTTFSQEAEQPTSMKNKDWWGYRNNQRIGVAWSDTPYGPWKRLDRPVLDVSTSPTAPDALMVSNPAINVAPDGKIFAVYKAVGKQKGWKPVDMASSDSYRESKGSRVRYMVAFADSPFGPFEKHNETIFELKDSENEHMIAEDPFVWADDQNYYAIVTDIKGRFTGDAGALALMQSSNGYDWVQAKHPLVLPSKIPKQDGTFTEYKVERPQLLIENGTPTHIFGALGITVNGVHRGHACNLRIPLAP